MSWCLQGLPRATRLSCSQLKASRLPLAVHPDSNRYVGRYTGLHVRCVPRLL